MRYCTLPLGELIARANTATLISGIRDEARVGRTVGLAHDWKIIPPSSLPEKCICKNLLAVTCKIHVSDPGVMPGVVSRVATQREL